MPTPGAWVFLEQRYPTLDVVGVSRLALDAEVSAQESHRRFRDQFLGCCLRAEAVLQVAVETALSRRLRTCDLFGGPVAACENVCNIDPTDKVAKYFDSVAFTRDFAGVTLRVKRDPIQSVHFPAQSGRSTDDGRGHAWKRIHNRQCFSGGTITPKSIMIP